MDKKTNFNAWYVMIAVVAILIVQAIFQQTQKTEYLPYSQFQSYLQSGKVDQLVITETRIIGTLKDTEPGKPTSFVTTRVDPSFAKELEKYNVEFRGGSDYNFFTTLLSWVLPVADLLRHLDLPAAPDVDGRHGRRRPDVDRQEPRQDLRREGHQDHARRRRRRRRGQGRAPGGRRLPEGPRRATACSARACRTASC